METFTSSLRLERSYSRFLGKVGLVFALSAAVHLIVAIARGFDLAGPVSFRKPITFAVSLGLMVWAMGWIMDRLPQRPRLGWILAVIIGVGSLLEWALITLQSWRGEASHFNFGTPFDSGVFAGMGISILVVSLGLGVLAVWTLFEIPRSLRLPVWSGMLLLLLGLGIGLVLIDMGTAYWEANLAVPSELTVGSAGVAKFPHATSLHGIQLFIVTLALAQGLPKAERTRIVRLVVGGYTALVVWSILHTNFGRAPGDPAGLESMILFAGLGSFVLAGLTYWVGSRRVGRPSTLPA